MNLGGAQRVKILTKMNLDDESHLSLGKAHGY